MKIFLATSYSTKVNYDTGEVYPEFKEWLENIFTTIEKMGHTPFSAMRQDWYRINDADPAKAFFLDYDEIRSSDVMLALVDDHVSAGVQTEIGIAVAMGKKLILAHLPEHKLTYFNDALVKAGNARELILPITAKNLQSALD